MSTFVESEHNRNRESGRFEDKIGSKPGGFLAVFGAAGQEALHAETLELMAESERVDAALNATIDPDGEYLVGHSLTGGAARLATLYASTGGFMLTCVSDGDLVQFRINHTLFRRADLIPPQHRKLGGLARRFEQQHASGAIRDSIAARSAYEDAYARWMEAATPPVNRRHGSERRTTEHEEMER